MAFTLLGLLHLSVLLLSSFTVLSHNAPPPHYLPIIGHAPIGAPKPSKGHHIPKLPLTPPPIKLPTLPPVKLPAPPPTKLPTLPPVKLPTPPPTKLPTLPPVKLPSPGPAKPPTLPPHYPPVPVIVRKAVAVQGVVYCKSCKYVGINTLTNATALANATVRLVCANTKYHLIQEAKTDKNGYFLILPKNLSTTGSHKCKVFLISSPSAKCNVPTDLQAGKKGAILIPTLKSLVPTSPKFQFFTVGPFAFEPAKKCY